MQKQMAPACLCFVVAVEVVAVGRYGWIRAMELGWYGSKISSWVDRHEWIKDIELG